MMGAHDVSYSVFLHRNLENVIMYSFQRLQRLLTEAILLPVLPILHILSLQFLNRSLKYSSFKQLFTAQEMF